MAVSVEQKYAFLRKRPKAIELAMNNCCYPWFGQRSTWPPTSGLNAIVLPEENRKIKHIFLDDLGDVRLGPKPNLTAEKVVDHLPVKLFRVPRRSLTKSSATASET